MPPTLSTVAAAIAETPWSIALATMWKIGPECAAQHAKNVSAMAANCGVRSACATVRSRSGGRAAGPPAPGAIAGGFLTSSAAGMTVTHTRSPSTIMATRQS